MPQYLILNKEDQETLKGVSEQREEELEVQEEVTEGETAVTSNQTTEEERNKLSDEYH